MIGLALLAVGSIVFGIIVCAAVLYMFERMIYPPTPIPPKGE